MIANTTTAGKTFIIIFIAWIQKSFMVDKTTFSFYSNPFVYS